MELEVIAIRITLFIAIITSNFRDVVFTVLWPYFIGRHMASSSRSTRIGVFLFTFPFLKPFFRLFSSFLWGRYVFRGIICNVRLWGLKLSFFNPSIFYGSILDFDFGCNNVNRAIVLPGLMIHLQNIGSGLQVCFRFSLYCFHNYRFSSV